MVKQSGWLHQLAGTSQQKPIPVDRYLFLLLWRSRLEANRYAAYAYFKRTSYLFIISTGASELTLIKGMIVRSRRCATCESLQRVSHVPRFTSSQVLRAWQAYTELWANCVWRTQMNWLFLIKNDPEFVESYRTLSFYNADDVLVYAIRTTRLGRWRQLLVRDAAFRRQLLMTTSVQELEDISQQSEYRNLFTREKWAQIMHCVHNALNQVRFASKTVDVH